MKIAYIVSSAFSGSTLLSMVLNAHPDIATISEFDRTDAIAANPEFECSCGEQLRDCFYFKEVARLMADQGCPFRVDDMDLMLTLHSNRVINKFLTGQLPKIQSSALERMRDSLVDAIPVYRRGKADWLRRNKVFMSTVMELKNASVFLDANKDPYRMRFLANRFDVRAIYLVKNGIAGVYSYVKNTAGNRHPLDVVQASSRWFSEQITISRILDQMDPQKTLLLGYSEFCANPPAAVKRICDLLEVEAVSLDSFFDAPHHIIGNRMRLTNVDQISERTDWKERMSASDIAAYKDVFDRYHDRLRAANPHIVDHIWR